MRLLAIETSTELGSCALWQNGQVVERYCPAGRPHSETLLPLVQALMAENGLATRQLDAIAFGAGPGAFTGLRVACGIAQGLAVAAELPVIPVGTLEALAWRAGVKRCLAVLDARVGEVYWGRFERLESGLALRGAIHLSAPEAVELPDAAEGWQIAGNALLAYPFLAKRSGAVGLPELPEVMPSAGAVATLAVPRFAAGEAVDPAKAAPLYVRDKVAKTVAERLAAGGKA